MKKQDLEQQQRNTYLTMLKNSETMKEKVAEENGLNEVVSEEVNVDEEVTIETVETSTEVEDIDIPEEEEEEVKEEPQQSSKKGKKK